MSDDAPVPRAESFQPRPARPGDEPAILAVLEAVFGRWPYADLSCPPLEHLQWKMTGPRGDSGLSWVVESGGRVVATHIGYTTPATLAGRPVVRWQASDAAVLSEARGGGVYRELRKHQFERLCETCDLQFGYAVNPAIIRVTAHERWQDAANTLESLVLPLRAGPYLRRQGLRGAANAVQHLVTAKRHQRRPRAVAPASAETPLIDERFDALSERAAEGFDFISDRSSTWIRWRYSDPRAGDFSVLTEEQAGELLGYAVTRISRGSGFVADILVLPGREDVVATLVERAVAQLRAAGVADVTTWLPRTHAYRAAFRRLGFSRAGSRPLRVGSLRTGREELALFDDPDARIHFTMGDLDLV